MGREIYRSARCGGIDNAANVVVGFTLAEDERALALGLRSWGLGGAELGDWVGVMAWLLGGMGLVYV